MALDFNGFRAWQAVADNEELFSSLRAEASKSARAALTKFIKSKTIALSGLRDVRKVLGKETFGLLVDGMKDSELKTLVARLDKHHPDLKAATADWRRRHFIELVRGEAEPAEKRAPAKKSKAKKKQKPDLFHAESDEGYSSAGAVRKR